MMCLKNFEALVHEGGRIDRDLGPHIPRGVRKGVTSAFAGQLLAGKTIKRATGACEPNAVNGIAPLALQTLENRAVFGIDGDELPFGCQGHEQIARHYDRLLVCVCQALSCLEGRIARMYARKAHKGIDNAVDVIELCEGSQGFRAHT